jgi:hypothetical protein
MSLFISKRGGIIPVFWLYNDDIKWHIQLPMPNLSLIFLGIELGIESLSRICPEFFLASSGQILDKLFKTSHNAAPYLSLLALNACFYKAF